MTKRKIRAFLDGFFTGFSFPFTFIIGGVKAVRKEWKDFIGVKIND